MMDDQSHQERWQRAREALIAAEREAELLGPDPDLLARYAGQWVIIHDGQVIASAARGDDLVKIVDIREHPDAVVLYVPTAEEQTGVQILRTAAHETG